jgi:hypothetical protein
MLATAPGPDRQLDELEVPAHPGGRLVAQHGGDAVGPVLSAGADVAVREADECAAVVRGVQAELVPAAVRVERRLAPLVLVRAVVEDLVVDGPNFRGARECLVVVPAFDVHAQSVTGQPPRQSRRSAPPCG